MSVPLIPLTLLFCSIARLGRVSRRDKALDCLREKTPKGFSGKEFVGGLRLQPLEGKRGRVQDGKGDKAQLFPAFLNLRTLSEEMADFPDHVF